MIDFLKEYWDKFTGNDVIKTGDMIVSMEQQLASFESNSVMIDQLTIMVREVGVDKRYTDAAKQIGFTENNPEKLLERLIHDFDVLVNGLSDLIKISKKELPKLMTHKTMTVKQATIINLSEKLSTLITAYPSMILFILYKAAGDDKLMYKAGYKEVLEISTAYQVEMAIFSKGGKHLIADIPKLSDTLLSGSVVDIRNSSSSIDSKYPMTDNKFVRTWIYNVGKWWVDMEIEKLEKAKNERRLIELKLIELREIAETGNVSTSISKQISYYEEKLARLNKNIKELSEIDED